MGQIVGAAIASHHPGLMQCEDFRKMMGAGRDSDLIAGYARLRERIVAARPDVVMIFDSHWFTTGYHLVDGAAPLPGLVCLGRDALVPAWRGLRLRGLP
jgi:3,4-dihydroxyphenylacetate 2,3-dioxygenase